MALVIRNTTIVASDTARTVHHDASIVVDADRIVAIGSLEVGKKADLIVLDARRPHLVPTLRIVSGWIRNGHAGDVESVMVDGRWLMRDRRVLTIDEEDIVTRAEEIGRRVWYQLVDRYPNVPFPITLPPPVSRR